MVRQIWGYLLRGAFEGIKSLSQPLSKVLVQLHYGSMFPERPLESSTSASPASPPSRAPFRELIYDVDVSSGCTVQGLHA